MDLATLHHATQLRHLRFPVHAHGPVIDIVAIALASAASWLGAPGPGEALLVAAGVAAAHHDVALGGVIVIAWAGAVGGSMTGWLVGRLLGRPLLEGEGPLRSLRRRTLASGERLYRRHATVAAVVGPPLLAGIYRMSAPRFAAITAVAAAVWAVGLGLGGEVFGPTMLEWFGDLGTAGTVALGILVAVALGRRLTRARRRARAR